MTLPEPRSLPGRYFDDVYQQNPDPWDFATSAYEDAKYSDTLAALPRERYRSAFEAGCSIGVLTKRLATRCDRLLSVDIADAALAQARDRCGDQPWVCFRQMALPGDFPDGPFDLILLSEVGYYLSLPDLERARRRIVERLEPGGHLLLVHWTPPVHDYPLTGDQVHDHILGADDETLRHLGGHRRETYRLDLFARTSSDPPGEA